MEKNTTRKYNFIIAIWIVLFSLSELIMIFNMINKCNKDNAFVFVMAMILIAVIYTLGILLSLRLKKKLLLNENKGKTITLIILHFLLALCTFVGLVEASLDAKTTTDQVKKIIMFLKGEKEEVYIESFEVEISNQKELYEIGDVINYDIILTPKDANVTTILYSIGNEIVEVDTYNKTIKCLKNGECNITFYDNHNNNIKFVISIEIYSNIATEITLEGDTVVYLNQGEDYQLNANVYPNDAIDSELEYSSSNKEVVIVDSDGVIKSLKPGAATITITNGNIKKDVYVYVDSINEFTSNQDTLLIYPGINNTQNIKIKVDNIFGIDQKYIKIINPDSDKVAVKYSGFNIEEEWLGFTLTNNMHETDDDITVEVIIKYSYPHGKEFSETITIMLVNGKIIEMTDIDLERTETSVDQTIYYDDRGLVTKKITSEIYYNKSTHYNENAIKFESDDNIDLSACRYDRLQIGIKELNLEKEKYAIKYYPNKEKEEYILFIINIKYEKVTNYDSSFDLDYLYEKGEGKKNEIWYTYFNEELFEKATFTNNEFNDSGLMIILSDESKELLDFEINEYGFIIKLEFKNTNQYGIPNECQLTFEVCSLYEYNNNNDCMKKTYTIDIKKEFDDAVVIVDGSYEFDDEGDLFARPGDVLEFEHITKIELEYKGEFQNNIKKKEYIANSLNNKVASISVDVIYCYEYGVTKMKIALNSDYYNISHTVVINIYVTDENGDIPEDLSFELQLSEYDKDFMPSGNKYSVGTMMKIVPNYDSEYEYSSSNSEIASVDNNGIVRCIASGVVEIVCKEVNSQKQVVSSIIIYEKTYPFALNKGNFTSMREENGVYIFTAKVKKMYRFDIAGKNDEKLYSFHIETSDSCQLENNGNIVINKIGNFKGYIVAGDENSPYKEVVEFEIEVVEDGITAALKYFVRKLVGHFGYFLALGALSFIIIFMMDGFKINKYISLVAICVFGIYMAFTTEFIQKTDSTRFYSFDDMVLDSQGYFLGVGIMVVIYCLYILVKKIKIKKAE